MYGKTGKEAEIYCIFNKIVSSDMSKYSNLVSHERMVSLINNTSKNMLLLRQYNRQDYQTKNYKMD